jgi:hypothetical protein
MSGGNQLNKSVKIELINTARDDSITLHIDTFSNSLSGRWLQALEDLVKNNYHLEKNYCFFGFANGPRNAEFMCNQINQSIQAINQAQLGYHIDDHFTPETVLLSGPIGDGQPGRKLNHDRFNKLHRYFEDLQGVSGALSPYYQKADPTTRWHIRQLNLLCHEFESWALSYRKSAYVPEWCRMSQLMCWLNAPRFALEPEDYELFGVDTIARPMGGVYVGVNKAVGKHHWEVFHDEGRDSRIDELTTTTLRAQTEAAGDFDIEWGQNPGEHKWMQNHLEDFRTWLRNNGFDPDNKALTIGHPQVGQVDLLKTFGTEDKWAIWQKLEQYLDVYKVSVGDIQATYNYRWSDDDFVELQVERIKGGN